MGEFTLMIHIYKLYRGSDRPPHDLSMCFNIYMILPLMTTRPKLTLPCVPFASLVRIFSIVTPWQATAHTYSSWKGQSAWTGAVVYELLTEPAS